MKRAPSRVKIRQRHYPGGYVWIELSCGHEKIVNFDSRQSRAKTTNCYECLKATR